jgi:serine phosphatase RsbU (regulator of sigma subunit)
VSDSALLDLVLRGQRVAPSDVGALVVAAGEVAGALAAVAYLSTYGETHLVPLASSQTADRRELSVDGTVAGRAFTSGRVVTAPPSDDETRTCWVPLLDASARLGVLELVLPGSTLHAVTESHMRDVAAVVATVLVKQAEYGDIVEFTRRRSALSVAAELQWSLLPPQSYASPRMQLAASLEPSTEVAGDSFDYAMNGDLLHLAVLDSMGHGLASGAVSSVALSAYRNARRELRGLVETARAMEDAIALTTDKSRFVTAVLAELEVTTGEFRWISAGHPMPLLLRDGRGSDLSISPVPPLGLGLWRDDVEIGARSLQPEDQILLYTDGVVEARGGREGGPFSLERLADFILREVGAALPAAEALRRLNRAILDYQGGLLQDDATTLLVRWGADPVSSQPRLDVLSEKSV